jgi:ankyrin repeat protein
MSIDFDALNKLHIESLNNRLVKASALGELELVEALLISPKLKMHPDINANNDHALRWACIKNQATVIKYLLRSQNLKKHADIHTMLDTPFKEALRHENEELLQFYIFDLKIKRTQYIDEVLAENIDKSISKKIESMFQARDLEKILPINNINEKIRPKL